MTYRLDSISIRLTDDREGFEKINEIYEDIFKGNIPLITMLISKKNVHKLSIKEKFYNIIQIKDGKMHLILLLI